MRILIILLLSITISENLNAQLTQQFYKKWDKTLGSSGHSKIVDIQFNDTTVFLFGEINGSGVNITNHYGGSDVVFLKVSPTTGNIISQFTYGGNGNEFVGNVLALNDGYLVSVFSNSNISGTKTINRACSSFGCYDIVLVKLDLNLNIRWQKSYISVSNCQSLQGRPLKNAVLTKTPFEDFYLLGAEFMCQETPIDVQFIEYIRLDSSGVVVNRNVINTFPSSSFIELQGLYYFSNNEIYMSWTTQIGLTVCRINQLGTVLNTYSYPTGGRTFLIDMYKKQNNNICYITIDCGANNDPAHPLYYPQTVRTVAKRSPRIYQEDERDIWIFETTSAGIITSNQFAYGVNDINTFPLIKFNFHGFSNLVLNNIDIRFAKQSIGDTLYFAINSYGNGYDKTDNSNGNVDYWILKIHKQTLQLLSEKGYGGNLWDFVHSFKKNPYNGDMFIAGTSISAQGGDKSNPPISSSGDMWLLNLGECFAQQRIYFNGDSMTVINGDSVTVYFACHSENKTFNVLNPQPNHEYRWFNSTGMLIHTGNSYTVPSPQSQTWNINPTEIKVRAVNLSGNCIGKENKIWIWHGEYMQNPTINFNNNVCKGSQVQLCADTTNLYGKYFLWRDENLNLTNAGINLNCLTTQILTEDSTNIYFSYIDSTCVLLTGINPVSCVKKLCESKPLKSQINTVFVPIPQTNNTSSIYCRGDNILLSVSNPAIYDLIHWFADSTYQQLLSTGTNFGYLNILTDDTVFVAGYNNIGCPSKTKLLKLKTNNLNPSFVASTTNILEGTPLALNNTSTADFPILGYTWSLEDGTIYNTTNIIHYFYLLGLNDVTLSAYDSLGCYFSVTYNDYINVLPFTGTLENNNETINVFPNPFVSTINIFNPNGIYSQIEIIDYLGKTVFQNILEIDNSFNLEFLNSGIYILKIFDKENNYNTIKIIKQ
ncbi:MAG: T9SS type A sorting domain-containing protein [Bacteroidia bacterium]